MKNKNTTRVSLQNASGIKTVPTLKLFKHWVNTALNSMSTLSCEATKVKQADICIRLITEEESAHLNSTYRKKTGPTNILSFTYEQFPLLHGDLAICVPVMFREAAEQHICLDDHWAHLTIHGVLHLLGYDHEKEEEAVVMEALEQDILKIIHLSPPRERSTKR